MTAKLKLNAEARKWLRKNEACEEGYKWASQNCSTLAEVVTTARSGWALWVLLRPGVLTDRELWLFACWCAEQALPAWYAFAPNDHRPRQAIEARRGWLDGTVSDEQLATAASAASSAAWSARSAESAESAARAAAWAAAWAAEWAARPAAAAAATAATAATAARPAAAEARSAQVAWLLANTSPVFADGSTVEVAG